MSFCAGRLCNENSRSFSIHVYDAAVLFAMVAEEEEEEENQ